MAVIAPGWQAAFAPNVQEREWRAGGVFLFQRLPELIMQREEVIKTQAGSSSGGRRASIPGAVLGMAPDLSVMPIV